MVAHIQGWGIIGVLRCLSTVWGKGTAAKLTEKLSDQSKQLLARQLQSSEAYPISLATELLAEVEKAYGNGQGAAMEPLGYAVGQLAIEVVFSIFRAVGDLERAIGSLPKAWKKVYPDTQRHAEVVSSSSTAGVIRFYDFLDVPTLWIPFWIGWFKGYLEGATGRKGHIRIRAVEIESAIEFHISAPYTT